MDLRVEIDTSGDTLRVKLHGSLTEFSEEALAVLHKYGDKSVTFDFAELDQLNSSGVRIWIFFIATFAAKRQVYLTHCPDIMVPQFSMIPQVTKRCEVVSVIGRFQCDPCHTVKKRVYDFAALLQSGGRTDADDSWPCSTCGAPMESLEDETFFDFINEALQKRQAAQR